MANVVMTGAATSVSPADAALLCSELGAEALRRTGILEDDLRPKPLANFDRKDGDELLVQRLHEYERRREHKWGLLREEHRRLSAEAERAKRGGEISAASAAETAAERRERLRRAQALSMRQALDRQALILERDAEAEEIRQRMESRLQKAQSNRDELAAERQLRHARLQAYRESLESLHQQKLSARRASPPRALSAPRASRGGGDRAGSMTAPSRLHSSKSHKAAVAHAAMRRQAAWEERDRSLLDRLKIKESRAQARRTAESAGEDESRRRQRALGERVQLRRELHRVASESRNYAFLAERMERAGAQLGRSASTGRLEMDEEAARRRKNERERGEQAAAARRQAAAAAVAARRAQLARKLEEKASAHATDHALHAAARAREEYEKKERARLRVLSARVVAVQAENKTRRSIETKLERAEEQRKRRAAAAVVNFDVLRRREAAVDNQEMRRRATQDKEERIRRSIAAKERLFEQRRQQQQEEAEMLRIEREALRRREETLRKQLSCHTTAHDLVTSAATIAQGPLTGASRHQVCPRPKAHTPRAPILAEAPPRRRMGPPRGRPAEVRGSPRAVGRVGWGGHADGSSAMASIESLRRQQNEALMRLLEEEQAREAEREALLMRSDGADRERLRKIFEVERSNAEEDTMAFAAHHELELAKEMARLGMTR